MNINTARLWQSSKELLDFCDFISTHLKCFSDIYEVF